MKCTNCRKQFHPQPQSYKAYWVNADENDQDAYAVASQQCPSCGSIVIYLEFGEGQMEFDGDLVISGDKDRRVIYPPNSDKDMATEIPDVYRKELAEARAVLEYSPKASAALSRRLLQRVLRERLGIKRRDLSQEIDAFVEMSGAPSYLTDAVDAVRHIGNFAAHPLKDTNTGEITDVEDGEAEWTLEVVESLLDFACVQPVKLAARRAALNKKLEELGKPPLKGA